MDSEAVVPESGSVSESVVSESVVSESAPESAPPRLARVLGEHVLLEAAGADAGRLDDLAYLERAVGNAVSGAGLTLVLLKAHRFAPQGVSVVAVLAESHLTVHTWPELGYAAVDAYTCGAENKRKARAAAVAVAEAVRARGYHVRKIERGVPSGEALREAAAGRRRRRRRAAAKGQASGVVGARAADSGEL